MDNVQLDVLHRIDESRDDIVKLIQDLVRIPSEAKEEFIEGKAVPMGDYGDIIKFVSSKLREYGLEVKLVGRAGKNYEHKMPVGMLRGTTGKTKLMFMGHLDTVVAGNRDAWTVDPFGGEIIEGRIYGRGAADDKGQFAAALILPKIFRDEGVRLNGDLVLWSDLDEEIGGANGETGTWNAVTNGELTSDTADYGIYAEGYSSGSMSIAVRGILQYEITIFGTPGSAWCIGRTDRKFINPIIKASKISTIIHEELLPKVLEEKTKLPLADPIQHPDSSTITCSMVHGGYALNAIPDSCKLYVEYRIPPEVSMEQAEKRFMDFLEDLKARDPELDFNVKTIRGLYPSMISDYENQPVCKALEISLKEVGLKPKYALSCGGNPAAHPVSVICGIPQPSIGSGEEKDISHAHMPDECIRIDNVVRSTKVFALTAMNLLA